MASFDLNPVAVNPGCGEWARSQRRGVGGRSGGGVGRSCGVHWDARVGRLDAGCFRVLIGLVDHTEFGGGYQQDPARDRDHAGEPVVRQLLRHLPRCGRHPDGQRLAVGLRAGRRGSAVRAAFCRPRRRQRRRTAQPSQRRRRHRRRQDGRLRHPAVRCAEELHRPEQPRLHQLRHPGRAGLPHRLRHPELLVLRPRLRAAGPHVRTERLLEPARAPVPSLGVVSRVHPAQQPRLLHQRAAEPWPADARRFAGLGDHRRHRSRQRPDLRLDRPDLAAAQEQHQLGVLRRRRHRAGL